MIVWLTGGIEFVFALALTDALSPWLAGSLQGPAFAVIYTMTALDIMRRTNSQRFRKILVATTSIVAALCFSISVLGGAYALTAILSLAAGAILLMVGLSARSHTAVFGGITTLIIGTIFGLEDIWKLVLASSWIDLAIFGACAIVLGSIVDRHGVVIKLHLVKWFDAIGERQAQMALEE